MMQKNRILIYVIWFLFPSISIGQCEISASASQNPIYCGQSTTLSAYGYGVGNIFIQEGFNDQTLPSGWSSNATYNDFNNPCPPSADGTPSLWLHGASTTRGVTTTSYDLSGSSSGVKVCFDLKYGPDEGGADICEGPDGSDEGVYFQYSTDGGLTWNTIHYFEPTGGYNSAFINWNNWCFDIPVGAITSNTIFRWNQDEISYDEDYDNWGIDNFEITIYDVLAEIEWGTPGDDYYYNYGTGSTGGDNPNPVSPTTTTTYHVKITTGDGNVCTDDVTIDVIAPIYQVEVEVDPAEVCEGKCTNVTGTASQINKGQNIHTHESTTGFIFSTPSGASGPTPVSVSNDIVISTQNVTTIDDDVILNICIDKIVLAAGSAMCPGGSLDDMKIVLKSPDGTEIILVNTGQLTGQEINGMCFEPGGADIVTGSTNNYNGAFEPYESFSNLNGHTLAGTWTIQIDAIINAPGGGPSICAVTSNFNKWNITIDDWYAQNLTDFSWTSTLGVATPDDINTEICPVDGETYELTVSNGESGCATHTETISIVINPNPVIDDMIETAPTTCNTPCNGQLEVVVINGTLPYTYEWKDDNDNMIGTNNNSIDDLCAGNYKLTVTDDKGCVSVEETTTLNNPPLDDPSFTLTNFCEGTANSATGIAAPGGTFSIISPLGDGATINASTGEITDGIGGEIYTIEYETSDACPDTHQENVTIYANPTYTITTIDPTCGNNNGGIEIIPNNGFTITDYSIDGGITFDSESDFLGLTAGNYTIQIIDDNECRTTGTTPEVLTNIGAPDDPSFVLTDFCEGTANAASGIATPGGTFNIISPTGDGATIITTTGEILNGNAGTTYTIEYQTMGTCPKTEEQDVILFANPTYTLVITDPTCGNDNGEIMIAPSSGFTITDYSIDGGTNTQSGGSFSSLTAGNYTIQVLDDNGCEATENKTLSNIGSLDNPAFTLTDFCEEMTNSAANIATSGGTFNIVFPLNDGAVIDATTGEIINGVGGTTYTIEYETNGVCPDTHQEDVTVNPKPTFTTSTTSPSCDSSDGIIIITPDPGVSINEFSIDGGTTTQSNGNFSNLEAGSYSTYVIDGNGCEATEQVTVGMASAPSLTIDNSTDVSCFGEADGSAVIKVAGGKLPYNYNWTPVGGNTATATGLAPGIYTLNVEDAAGCKEQIQVTIAEPSELIINKSITPSDCGQDNGAIELTVTGGFGDYTYAWVPNVGNTNEVTGLSVGSYEATVSDDNGCSQTTSCDVPLGSSFSIDVTPDNMTILQGESTALNIFVDPDIIVDNIFWVPPNGLSCTDCLNPIATPENTTTYIVMLKDKNGCISTDSVLVNVTFPCADIFVPNTFSPNADGLNDFHCVLGDCIVALEFTIFNRWGEAVFQTTDQKECWDGTYRGKLVQSGNYIYQLKVTLEDAQIVEQQGNITLVR